VSKLHVVPAVAEARLKTFIEWLELHGRLTAMILYRCR